MNSLTLVEPESSPVQTWAASALRSARAGCPDAWQAAVYALTVAASVDDAATCTALVALAIAERNDGNASAACRWARAAVHWAERSGCQDTLWASAPAATELCMAARVRRHGARSPGPDEATRPAARRAWRDAAST